MGNTSGLTCIAESSEDAYRRLDRWPRSGRTHTHGCGPVGLGLLLLIAAGYFSGAWAQTSEHRSPAYRVDVKVELVDLFATVHDRSGKLVTGLRKDDFVIYDNGVPQTISAFSQEYISLSVLILLDTSSSMLSSKKLENAKQSLLQFLKRLQPGDEAMLITFQTRSHIAQEFTQDLGRLRRELKRVEGNGSTALYDAVLSALDRVKDAHNRRRALLLITDGINTYGKAELQETISRLQRGNVELFAIGLESTAPEDLQDSAVTRSVLSQLTKSAGGEPFFLDNPKDLAKICATISHRMHNQYTFGYYPPQTRDSRWHSVRLEAKVPGLRVIASKTGYYPMASRDARPQ